MGDLPFSRFENAEPTYRLCDCVEQCLRCISGRQSDCLLRGPNICDLTYGHIICMSFRALCSQDCFGDVYVGWQLVNENAILILISFTTESGQINIIHAHAAWWKELTSLWMMSEFYLQPGMPRGEKYFPVDDVRILFESWQCHTQCMLLEK